MAPTLLWVGLGNMGRGMCRNIVEKGQLDSPLLIYNRSTERAEDLSSKLPVGKTEVVDSLAAAVPRADVIFTCVADDEAVRELFRAMLEDDDVKGKLFVDCSTIHPESTEAIARDVLASGAEFVAAPVFGAPAAAEAGQLIGVLAGPRASVDRAKPWFSGVMARTDIDLGGQPCGRASTLKVLGNTFVFNMVEQLAEAHVVAEKSGLGTHAVHQFVEALFPGPYAAYSTRMLTGDYHKRREPLFAVGLARKDARHAKNIAAAAGASIKTLELADAHFAMVREHCGESGDIAGIYGAARQEAGLKFENDAYFLQQRPPHQPLPKLSVASRTSSTSALECRWTIIFAMAQWYSIFIGLAVIVVLCVASWFLAPKGQNQVFVIPFPTPATGQSRRPYSAPTDVPLTTAAYRLWRSSLILSIVSCFLMWAITFLAQLNPLIVPKRSDLREKFLEH
ncbi:putative oxidoreductase YfjR [Tolypocladium ophioglossoides CBS 100239]|uniref:Putative oxidoreductase YfjR n=1 Tax=Tolypocladium ophioglossoides (strain CBS 100239) TaxID=1163406 RepID=A0A0L0MYA8_TOLOC|nr:putative oxidoreductase YfjR [Tolypocladium ophioglossoides CBS 100239]